MAHGERPRASLSVDRGDPLSGMRIYVMLSYVFLVILFPSRVRIHEFPFTKSCRVLLVGAEELSIIGGRLSLGLADFTLPYLIFSIRKFLPAYILFLV